MAWPAAIGSGLAFSPHKSGRSGPWQSFESISIAPSGATNVTLLTTTTDRIAQTFTPAIGGNIQSVTLYVKKNGSPTFDVAVDIYAVSGGEPTGSSLATATFAASSLTTTLADVVVPFSVPVSLSAGTTYAFVISKSGGDNGDNTNNIGIAIDNANPYSGGNRLSFSSNWTPSLGSDVRSTVSILTNNLYGVFRDSSTVSLEVWKSTDGGQTWTEMDAANHPAVNTSFDSYAVGSTLHITVCTSGGTASYRPFDMATDTWTTSVVTTVGTVTTDASVSQFALGIVATTDGDIFVFYSGSYSNMGSKDAVYYRKSTDGGASFGSAVQFSPALANHYGFRGCAEGLSNVVHAWMFSSNLAGVLERHLTSSDALSTATTATGPTNSGGTYLVGPPTKIARSAGTIFGTIFTSVGGGSSSNFLYVASANSTSAPTLTFESAISNVSDDSWINAAVGVGNETHLFWIPVSPGTSIMRNLKVDAGSYAGNTNWKTGLTSPTKIDAQPITVAGGDVGVFYDNGGVVYFDGYPALSISTDASATATATNLALNNITGSVAVAVSETVTATTSTLSLSNSSDAATAASSASATVGTLVLSSVAAVVSAVASVSVTANDYDLNSTAATVSPSSTISATVSDTALNAISASVVAAASALTTMSDTALGSTTATGTAATSLVASTSGIAMTSVAATLAAAVSVSTVTSTVAMTSVAATLAATALTSATRGDMTLASTDGDLAESYAVTSSVGLLSLESVSAIVRVVADVATSLSTLTLHSTTAASSTTASAVSTLSDLTLDAISAIVDAASTEATTATATTISLNAVSAVLSAATAALTSVSVLSLAVTSAIAGQSAQVAGTATDSTLNSHAASMSAATHVTGSAADLALSGVAASSSAQAMTQSSVTDLSMDVASATGAAHMTVSGTVSDYALNDEDAALFSDMSVLSLASDFDMDSITAQLSSSTLATSMLSDLTLDSVLGNALEGNANTIDAFASTLSLFSSLSEASFWNISGVLYGDVDMAFALSATTTLADVLTGTAAQELTLTGIVELAAALTGSSLMLALLSGTTDLTMLLTGTPELALLLSGEPALHFNLSGTTALFPEV